MNTPNPFAPNDTPLPEGLPEGVRRGDAWTCTTGCRHFVCAACVKVFTSSSSQEEREVEYQEVFGVAAIDDEHMSVCDDCNPAVLDYFREAGVL